MKLHIEHETIFSYLQPVREAVGEAKLRPRDEAGQRLHSFRLALDPPAPFDIGAAGADDITVRTLDYVFRRSNPLIERLLARI